MPETHGFEHLIEYLFRVGPGASNGMGYVGVSYPDIDAWSRLTRIPLTGWESETLKMMSDTYCGQKSISTKKDSVAPWSKLDENSLQSKRGKVAEGTAKALQHLASKPAKRARPKSGSRHNPV